MATRFRIYRRPIIANVETVTSVVKATIALHNFLLISQSQEGPYTYCPTNFADEEGTREEHLLGIGEMKLEQPLPCQCFQEMKEDQTTSPEWLKKFEMTIKITLTPGRFC